MKQARITRSAVSSTRAGFTLVELMICIAIIVALAAIALPVFGAAKKAAARSTASSNLRQFGMALHMYAEEYGHELAFPGPDVIGDVVKQFQVPTYDPADHWRSGPDEEWGPPLVGSFGYIRHVPPFDEHGQPKHDYATWLEMMQRRPNPSIVVSIFHGKPKVDPFKGLWPTAMQVVQAQGNLNMPDRILRLRMDGSVHNRRERTHSVDGRPLQFTWHAVFMELDLEATWVAGDDE